MTEFRSGARERAEAHPPPRAERTDRPCAQHRRLPRPGRAALRGGGHPTPRGSRRATHKHPPPAGIPTGGRSEAHADDRTKGLEPSSTPAGGPPSRPGFTAHPLQPMPPRAPETHARRRGRLRPPPHALLQHPRRMLHERARRAEGGWKRHSNIDTSKRNLEMPFAFKVSMIH